MHFIHTSINSLLKKFDKVHQTSKVTDAFIIGISETRLDKTISSKELEINDYIY